jgi:transcriptional regulator with XRE-family HTH domain
MKVDKKRRAQLRTLRKRLRLKQVELAVLAGVSPETVARYERCKPMSHETDTRIYRAVFRVLAQRNPEAVNQAARPFLEAAEKWERVLSLEPGSEPALKVEKLNGKSLAELKAQAEPVAGFLRSAANIALSLTK